MVSEAYRAAVYAPDSDEIYLTLLELSHPDLSETVRVVADHQGIEHQGETYHPVGFSCALPEQGEGVGAIATIGIENVSREIVAALRAAVGPPLVTIKEILASDPDAVEEEWPEFELVQATYTAAMIQGDLAYPDLSQIAFGGVFVPSLWSGIA